MRFSVTLMRGSEVEGKIIDLSFRRAEDETIVWMFYSTSEADRWVIIQPWPDRNERINGRWVGQ